MLEVLVNECNLCFSFKYTIFLILFTYPILHKDWPGGA